MELNGKTSLGLPGCQGASGERARVVFPGCYDHPDGESETMIFFRTSASEEYIDYALCISDYTPEKYDYIMYSGPEYNYLYCITSVDSSGANFVCDVNEIDSFRPSTSQTQYNDLVDIDVDINVVGRKVEYRKRMISSVLVKEASYDETLDIVTASATIAAQKVESPNYLYNFIISSKNGKTLSGLKFVIEFYSDNISPRMDTMLADKFSDATASGFNGNLNRYSMYDAAIDVRSEVNFDSERLDNFFVTIKDFDEGNEETDFTKDIYLMKKPLLRENTTYRAIAFAYVADGDFIDKIYVGEIDMSKFTNNFSETITETPSGLNYYDFTYGKVVKPPKPIDPDPPMPPSSDLYTVRKMASCSSPGSEYTVRVRYEDYGDNSENKLTWLFETGDIKNMPDWNRPDNNHGHPECETYLYGVIGNTSSEDNLMPMPPGAYYGFSAEHPGGADPDKILFIGWDEDNKVSNGHVIGWAKCNGTYGGSSQNDNPHYDEYVPGTGNYDPNTGQNGDDHYVLPKEDSIGSGTWAGDNGGDDDDDTPSFGGHSSHVGFEMEYNDDDDGDDLPSLN